MTGDLYVCGGGSNSALWSQMIADVLQIPLHVSPRPEVGARGASMAALRAIGRDFDAEAWTRPENIIKPDKGMAAPYDRGFSYYQEIVAAARPLWHSPYRL